MNIFLLSKYFKKNAEYHTDRHVVKMILESILMLCSAHIVLDNATQIDGIPLYRLTHKNHPCSVWVRKTDSNYRFLYNLMSALCDEYDYRFGRGTKQHLSCKTLKRILRKEPKNIPHGPLTGYCIAVPDEYKVYDSDDTINYVETYRKYYILGKRHLAKWTKRPRPYWYT